MIDHLLMELRLQEISDILGPIDKCDGCGDGNCVVYYADVAIAKIKERRQFLRVACETWERNDMSVPVVISDGKAYVLSRHLNDL